MAAAGFAICPSCHSAASSVTMASVEAGVAWRCTRCDQSWDAVRLATAAGYAAWDTNRTSGFVPIGTMPPGARR